MYKDLINFIQGMMKYNIFLKNRLVSKFEAERNKLTTGEQIDIMNELKRLEGMTEAFKLIVNFIENKYSKGEQNR